MRFVRGILVTPLILLMGASPALAQDVLRMTSQQPVAIDVCSPNVRPQRSISNTGKVAASAMPPLCFVGTQPRAAVAAKFVEPGADLASAIAPRLKLALSPAPKAIAQQLPDPKEYIEKAGEAADQGASTWTIAGYTLMGFGALGIYLGLNPSESYDEEIERNREGEDPPGGVALGLGVTGFVAGAFLWAVGAGMDDDRAGKENRAPRFWAAKTRGGFAAGIRIPIGR